MNYYVLRQELDNDPLTRGYSSMSDQEAANDLNTEYRTRNRVSMTPSEVYNCVVVSEWTALTDAQRAEIWDILHMGDPLNPFGLERDRFVTIFGGGSTTIANLASARAESISRAEELGLGILLASDVLKARAL